MVFVIQYIWCFKNFAALQIFFCIFLLQWRIKWRRFWVQCILWSPKTLFCFWLEALFLFFFKWSYQGAKLLGHINNVVLTFSNVAQINVEIDNVDSTLFKVLNFIVYVHNVVSSFIWRCAMSRRHINLKATLKTSLKCLLGCQ